MHKYFCSHKMFHRTSYAVTARLNIEMGSIICETNLDTMLHREHWLSFTIFLAVPLAQYDSHIILQQNKLELHKNVGMASQTLCKQSRDGIKVKINVQSPIPGSQSWTVGQLCGNSNYREDLSCAKTPFERIEKG